MAQKKTPADTIESGANQTEPETRMVDSRPRSRRKALIVGINDYQGGWNDLTCSVKDAEAIKDFLSHSLAFNELKMLTDREATLSNVLAGIDWLVEEAGAADHLVFYFSGNGFTKPEGETIRECLCLYDNLLLDVEIEKRTSELPAGILTLIIDCSFSGGLEKRRYEAVVHGLEEPYLAGIPNLSVEKARVKTFVSEPQQQTILEEAEQKATAYKPFGQPSMLIQNGFSTTGADRARLEGPTFNGVLIASCLVDDTAVATTSRTNGMSAFTYVLLKVFEQHGMMLPLSELMSLTTMQLRVLGLRQTPRVNATPEQLFTRSIFAVDSSAGALPSERLTDSQFINSIFDGVITRLFFRYPHGSNHITPQQTQWRETMYSQFNNPYMSYEYASMIPFAIEAAQRELIRRSYMQPAYGTPGSYMAQSGPNTMPYAWFAPQFGQQSLHAGEMPLPCSQTRGYYQPTSSCRAESCDRIAQHVLLSFPSELRAQIYPLVWNVLPAVIERIELDWLRGQQIRFLPQERQQVEHLIANVLIAVFQIVARERNFSFSGFGFGSQFDQPQIQRMVSVILPVIVENVERERARLNQQGLALTQEVMHGIAARVIADLQMIAPIHILQSIVPAMVDVLCRQQFATATQAQPTQASSLRTPAFV